MVFRFQGTMITHNFTMHSCTRLLSLAVLALTHTAQGAVSYELAGAAPLKFAAVEIERSANEAKQPVPDVAISIVVGAAQSYRIERDGNKIRVVGGDAAGAMYGGLDIAEAIRLGTLDTLQSSEHKPHIEKRGIKFNIPLDLRTPSYSDNSTSAQANIPEMWSLDFWHEFLDRMARDRFNVLTLWSMHPFPSIVKVPEYPKIALDDVWRTTAGLVEPFDSFSTRGIGMVKPWMLEKKEIVKRITIDEKIAFWRTVMDYAHDRGIEVYWFTWNVFTYGTSGQYGITDNLNNAATIDYFRKATHHYPMLAAVVMHLQTKAAFRLNFNPLNFKISSFF